MFLRIFQHLLPRAKAWSITASKALRTYWYSLSIVGAEFKAYSDITIYDNLFASKTKIIDEWIVEFGLQLSPSLSSNDKVSRVEARWAELGGQSPSYIEGILRQAGFDVYVYDWWQGRYTMLCGISDAQCGEPEAQCGQFVLNTNVGAPRLVNPFDYLRSTYLPKGGIFAQCGEPFMQCGEIEAQCGNTDEKIGYPLVNKIYTSRPDYTALCGANNIECGEVLASCGEFDKIIESQVDYSLPLNSLGWHYFAYVGGDPLGELATVQLTRKDEFENLCLRLFPAQLWLGIIVKYV